MTVPEAAARIGVPDDGSLAAEQLSGREIVTKAMELLLTGDTIPAAEAERIGLIGRVVPGGQALPTALEIADRIARNGPLAVQAVKRSVQATEGLPEEEALKIELEIGLPVFGTDDAKEGTRAFKEKRAPHYEGR